MFKPWDSIAIIQVKGAGYGTCTPVELNQRALEYDPIFQPLYSHLRVDNPAALLSNVPLTKHQPTHTRYSIYYLWPRPQTFSDRTLTFLNYASFVGFAGDTNNYL